MRAARPLAHFHEHQRAVRLAHHQVDLAAPAAGRPIIAREQPQPAILQMGQRAVFRRVAFGLGGRARPAAGTIH